MPRPVSKSLSESRFQRWVWAYWRKGHGETTEERNQWYVSGSAAEPYTVSEANDGNWSCSCMAWTRNHPREDCKHIMRVKLAEAVAAEVQVTKAHQVEFTGRVFR